MATESLGSVVLTLNVESATALSALEAFKRQATAAGDAAGRSLGKPISQKPREEIERLGRAAETATSPLKGLGGALGALGVGLSIGGVAAIFTQVVRSAVELETITRKLSNTLGPQGAIAALEFTGGIAKELGLNYKTLANTFASFTAAASAAGVPLDQQQQLFRAVAKAGQNLGLTNDELRGTFVALQQIASKGVVSMEELRQQLGERLPIALSAAALGLGVTQQQLIKLVESGTLTGDKFFPALTKGLNELTAASDGALTTAQKFEQLSVSWDRLQVSFGNSAIPTVTAAIEQLNSALEGLAIRQRGVSLGFSGDPRAGDQTVGRLRAVQSQYNLSDNQARNLFGDAVGMVAGGPGQGYDFLKQVTLDSNQLAKVWDLLPQLAARFRDNNKDTLSVVKEQEIIENRIAKAKTEGASLRGERGLSEVQRKDFETQQKLGAELRPLLSARKQAETSYNTAATAANAAAARPGEILFQKAVAARLELENAAVKLGNVFSQGLRSAFERRTSAQQGFANTITSNFDIASDQQRGFAAAVFRRQIDEAVAKNAVSPERLAAKFGFGFQPGGSLDINGVRRSFSVGVDTTGASLDKLAEAAAASQSVVDASQTLADALKNYSNTVSTLEKATGELVRKDWSVYVNVPGGSVVQGDLYTNTANRFQG